MGLAGEFLGILAGDLPIQSSKGGWEKIGEVTRGVRHLLQPLLKRVYEELAMWTLLLLQLLDRVTILLIDAKMFSGCKIPFSQALCECLSSKNFLMIPFLKEAHCTGT